MSLKEIIERFALVSGLEMKEISRWLPILMDCKTYFEEHLKDGLSESDMKRAVHACAVYACYRISLISQSADVLSFKVGDVQLTPLPLDENAEKLWLNECENVSDILDICGGFGFRSVTV